MCGIIKVVMVERKWGEKEKYMRGETKNRIYVFNRGNRKNTIRKCTVRERDLRVEREIEGKMNNERQEL
jgi:hypothetical protein